MCSKTSRNALYKEIRVNSDCMFFRGDLFRHCPLLVQLAVNCHSEMRRLCPAKVKPSDKSSPSISEDRLKVSQLPLRC